MHRRSLHRLLQCRSLPRLPCLPCHQLQRRSLHRLLQCRSLPCLPGHQLHRRSLHRLLQRRSLPRLPCPPGHQLHRRSLPRQPRTRPASRTGLRPSPLPRQPSSPSRNYSSASTCLAQPHYHHSHLATAKAPDLPIALFNELPHSIQRWFQVERLDAHDPTTFTSLHRLRSALAPATDRPSRLPRHRLQCHWLQCRSLRRLPRHRPQCRSLPRQPRQCRLNRLPATRCIAAARPACPAIGCNAAACHANQGTPPAQSSSPSRSYSGASTCPAQPQRHTQLATPNTAPTCP